MAIFAASGSYASSNTGYNYGSGDYDYGELTNKISEFIEQNWTAILIGIAVLFILALIYWVISIISRGALVGSVSEIKAGRQQNFASAFKIGLSNFWKVLVFGILLSLIFITIFIILSIIPMISIFSQLWWLMIISGLLSIILFIIVSVLIGIISTYALRFIIIEKSAVIRSFSESWAFIKSNWKEIILLVLISWVIGIVVAIGLIVAVLAILAILALIGFVIYTISTFATIIYSIIAGAIFLFLLIWVGGGINAFVDTYWTLSYLELKGK